MVNQTCAECGGPVVGITDPRQPEIVTYVCEVDWSHDWEADE